MTATTPNRSEPAKSLMLWVTTRRQPASKAKLEHMVVGGIVEYGPPQEMNRLEVCHAAQVVEDGIDVGVREPCLRGHALGRVFVLDDEWDGQRDLEPLASNEAQQPM